jgi:8-oxo-dGTP pyrophosphatase MutT (NUDIX family)
VSDIIRKVAWLHVADRKLLCARTAQRGLFYVPGGKPEPGEDEISALLREIAEELGVALISSTIRRAGSFSAPADGSPDKTVTISAYKADYIGQLSAGFEIAQWQFLTSAEQHRVSAVTRIILDHLKVRNVID